MPTRGGGGSGTGSSTTYKLSPSYTIYKSGSNYYAMDADGNIHSDTNFSTLLNHIVSTHLTSGGWMQLKGSTTYTLGNVALTFDDGGHTSKEWILAGEGINTILSQGNAGIDAIKINNSTRVTLRDFYVECDADAGHGIYLAGDGANEISLRRGTISNIHIMQLNPAKHGIYAVNIMDDLFSQIRVDHYNAGGGVGRPMRIETNSTTTHYGNSEFLTLVLVAYANHGLEMEGVDTKLVNICHFSHLQVWQGGVAAGTVGIRLLGNCAHNKFDYITSEDFGTAVSCAGSAGKYCYGNKFIGGNTNSTIGFDLDAFAQANLFSTMRVTTGGGGAGTILDDENVQAPNIYEDLDLDAGDTIHYHGNPILRGMATRPGIANPTYFSRWGSTANVNDGDAITHYLYSGPARRVLVSGSVANEFVSVSDNTDAAHFHVAIKKHDGSAGTQQTIYWYVEL